MSLMRRFLHSYICRILYIAFFFSLGIYVNPINLYSANNVFSTRAIKAIELLINSDGENNFTTGDDDIAYITGPLSIRDVTGDVYIVIEGEDVTWDGAHVFIATIQLYFQKTLAKTDDYTITTSDFGIAMSMNSTVSKTFTLPSVGTSENGALIGPLQKIGAGAMVIDVSDSDYIDDSGAGNTIYNDEGSGPPYPSISFMYNHGTTTWIKINSSGTWITTE